MKIISAIALLILSFFAITPAADARSWHEVSDRKTLGISGMAALNGSGTEFLVVHDNKNAGEPRLGKVTLIDGNINYETLPWPEDNLPVDLEAITAVPGRDREFVALTSSGRGYHIAVNSAIVELGTFSLPPVHAHANIEGFTLYDLDGTLTAIWGHRGAGLEPGVFNWGTIDLDTYTVQFQGSHTWYVPVPQGNVRHISDIKIDGAGVVFVSAASDEGDDGPFDSAVYAAGSLRIEEGMPALFVNAEPVPLLRHRDRKIEAIELMSAIGVILGSDDENRGASIFYP